MAQTFTNSINRSKFLCELKLENMLKTKKDLFILPHLGQKEQKLARLLLRSNSVVLPNDKKQAKYDSTSIFLLSFLSEWTSILKSRRNVV